MPEFDRGFNYRVVVVVAVALVEGVTPDVLPAVLPAVPEAPMELVPPVSAVPVPLVAGAPLLLLLEVAVSVLGAGAGALLLLEVAVSVLGAGAGVVVDELEDEVVGAGGASSRLVQAPSETAAMSASAAHEVRDAFIGKLLEGVYGKSSSGAVLPP